MRPLLHALPVVCALAATPSLAAELHVPLDQSTRVTLSGSAANVFIGNPKIADVAVIDRHSVLVTGKGYGATNLLVVDATGRTLYDRTVMVGTPGSMVLVQRGIKTASYNCSGICQTAPEPGGGGDPATGAGGASAPARP